MQPVLLRRDAPEGLKEIYEELIRLDEQYDQKIEFYNKKLANLKKEAKEELDRFKETLIVAQMGKLDVALRQRGFIPSDLKPDEYNLTFDKYSVCVNRKKEATRDEPPAFVRGLIEFLDKRD